MGSHHIHHGFHPQDQHESKNNLEEQINRLNEQVQKMFDKIRQQEETIKQQNETIRKLVAAIVSTVTAEPPANPVAPKASATITVIPTVPAGDTADRKYVCEPCGFESPYDFKLTRHKATAKHQGIAAK